jgi:hypothetical protein
MRRPLPVIAHSCPGRVRRHVRLMEAQVIIHLAGGIAEAVHRGVRHEVLRFAEAYCEMDADMEQEARAVLGDLFRVTAWDGGDRTVRKEASRREPAGHP